MAKQPTETFGFYALDVGYVDYLRNPEHGDEHVPYLIYEDRNKFFCGPMLTINDVNYFAPVSSKQYKNEAAFPIMDQKHQIMVSTVRLNYMIPVPKAFYKKLNPDLLTDDKYRYFVQMQEQYCQTHVATIKKQAETWYNKRLCGQTETREGTPINDFDLLDEAAAAYVERFGAQTTQAKYQLSDEDMERLERNYIQVSGNDPTITFDKFYQLYCDYTADDMVNYQPAKLKQFKTPLKTSHQTQQPGQTKP